MKSSFEETFTYQLLNNSDVVLGTLNGVQDGGSLEFSVSTDVRSTGSITLTKLKDIDWLHSRVRVYYNELPLITAIPSVPAENYDDAETTMQVDLYDKTLILLGDNFGGSYSVAAGTNIISKVIEVIQSTGETKIAIEPSTATLANTIVWEANTSKLKIVNDLLGAANYWSVWCDGMGYFRSSPYTAPAYRPVMYNFVDDATGMYLPAFTRNYDPFSVPNRYICVGKTDGDVEALSATATDESGGPFSYPGRPWLTVTETDVSYVDMTNLEAIAQRKLNDAQQVGETLTITHPYLGFGLNEVVTFTNKRYDTHRAVVQRQEWNLEVGGLIDTDLRVLA
jgi:hypothetical protein